MRLIVPLVLLLVAPVSFAADPPDDWTHKELVAHLEKKGVKVTVSAIPEWNKDGKTAAGFYQEEKRILVFLCRDAKQAREQAGAMGGKSFPYGRFAIGLYPNYEDNGAELLNDIIAALKP